MRATVLDAAAATAPTTMLAVSVAVLLGVTLACGVRAVDR